MHVVVEICHHVVYSKGRGDDAVDHHVLLLGDDSVQTLALYRFHRRHLLYARHCHDAVADSHCPRIRETEGCRVSTHTRWNNVVCSHLDVPAMGSGDVDEESGVFVGPMGHEHHV